MTEKTDFFNENFNVMLRYSKLSQTEIGRFLESSQQSVASWAKDRKPRMKKILQIADATGFSVDDLLNKNLNSLIVDKISNKGVIFEFLKDDEVARKGVQDNGLQNGSTPKFNKDQTIFMIPFKKITDTTNLQEGDIEDLDKMPMSSNALRGNDKSIDFMYFESPDNSMSPHIEERDQILGRKINIKDIEKYKGKKIVILLKSGEHKVGTLSKIVKDNYLILSPVLSEFDNKTLLMQDIESPYVVRGISRYF